MLPVERRSGLLEQWRSEVKAIKSRFIFYDYIITAKKIFKKRLTSTLGGGLFRIPSKPDFSHFSAIS